MANPLKRTKGELAAARGEFERMQQTKDTPDQYYAHWQGFLDRLEKVWRMAEREAEHVREPFRRWQQPFKETRETDSLLTYLRHARNADQHTVQRIAARGPGFQVRVPPGGSFEIDLRKGTLTAGGEPLILTKLGECYMVVPVVDRGNRYFPDQHLGKGTNTVDPVAIAEMGLRFYEAFVGEMQTRFFEEGDS